MGRKIVSVLFVEAIDGEEKKMTSSEFEVTFIPLVRSGIQCTALLIVGRRQWGVTRIEWEMP